MESHSRSIVKAVTWRAGGTVVTFFIAWIITGEATLSVGIGLLDSLVKVGAFYLHERMWNRLRFGKLEPPEYQI
jgi:uncharacterized membrane protein